MPTNYILARTAVASFRRNGKDITLSVATKTSAWDRPPVGVSALKPGFIASAKAFNGSLPADTAELVSRDGRHTSDEDPREHYTAAAQDKDGNHLKTVHIPAK